MMKILDRVEDVFCAASLLLTALVLFANVVLRYVFSASTSWAEELIRYLMIWITFIGGSINRSIQINYNLHQIFW